MLFSFRMLMPPVAVLVMMVLAASFFGCQSTAIPPDQRAGATESRSPVGPSSSDAHSPSTQSTPSPTSDTAAAATDTTPATQPVAPAPPPWQTLRASVDLRLQQPDDAGFVRLNGVLLIKLPDHVRFRAWKMGRTAFDITVTPTDTWVYASSRAGGGNADPSAAGPGPDLHALIQAIRTHATSPATAAAPSDGDPNRPTPHFPSNGITTADGSGVTFHDRITVDGISWPTRVVAVDPTGRTITVTCDEPRFNVTLPPEAFTPPRNARRVDTTPPGTRP